MGTYDTIGGTPRHDPAFDQDNTTELQEQVLLLLEAAGIPTKTNDKIIDLIAEAESELADQALTNFADETFRDAQTAERAENGL